MKEICVQYAAFNVWATERLLKALQYVNDQQLKAEQTSSFPSIHATLLHMWDAESIWWQRVKLAEQIQIPSAVSPSVQEVAAGLSQSGKNWKEHLSNLPDHAFNHVIAYRNSKKEEFKQPLWQIIMHAMNHATYHRGQVVTMMRTIGLKEIPSTDFIEFLRRKG